ncbi:hypothetical protein BGX26_004622 [Mortierella sp. AD094]|nr:hypothetical protein BGX26_004622 [Mortierella sp. AD094]
MGVDSKIFEQATDIFLNKSETIIQESARNKAIDASMNELVGVVLKHLKESRSASMARVVKSEPAAAGGSMASEESSNIDQSKDNPKNKTISIVRQQADAASESQAAPAKRGRKRNPGNIIGDVVKSSYKTVTLNLGTIDPRFRSGLQINYKANDSHGVREYIQLLIQDLVKLNTDLIRCGVMATFNYINMVMARYPSITEPEDIKSRLEKLQ